VADRSVRVRLVAEINSYIAGLKQASTATQQFGRELAGTGTTAKADIDKIANAGLVMGGIVAVGFGVAVNAAMGFDKQLSELAAVSSATGDELGQLRQAALDAGAATAFSASQAAQAQTELAKAGVSTADILGGALTGALDLAAAGGIDLARAAEISANAMSTFGLAGRDVGDIADTFAAGANKSAADVDELAQALAQSGLVADQFGLTLDDSVGVLAAFAQAGLKGSDAGTSFKTMLQRLTPQSAEAADLMRQLGIDMFDAAGDFIGIEGAAQELQDALGGLTEEQRNTALATLFGSDAVRGATILYQEGAEGIGEWIEQVDDAGFASEVAAKRLDNLAGDLEALRGSIEVALIEGGSRATDSLRFLTQSATNTINGFSGLPDVVQIVGQGMLGLAGAAGLVVGAVGKLGPLVTEGTRSLRNAGVAGNFLANNLGKIAGTAAVAGTALAVWSAWEGVLASARQEAAGFADQWRQSADIGGSSLAELEQNIQVLKAAQDDLSASADSSSAPWDADYREGLRAGASEAGELTAELERMVGITESLATHFGITRDQALSFVQSQMAAGIDVLAGDYADVVVSLAGVLATEGALTSALGNIGASATDGFGEAEDAAERAADAVDAYRDALRASTDPLFALTRAERNHADVQRNVGRTQQEILDAAAELEATRADPEASARDIERAQERVVDAWRAAEDAQLAVYESAFDVEQSQVDLAEAMATGATDVGIAEAALQRLADQGLITEEQMRALIGPFDELLGRVATLDTYSDIHMIVTADTSQAQGQFGLLIDTVYGLVPKNVPGGFIGPLAPGQTRLPGYNQFPTGQNPQPRAFGGPMVAGQSYLFEGHPEILTMGPGMQSGQVTPLYGMNQGLRPAGGGWGGGSSSSYAPQITVNGRLSAYEQLQAVQTGRKVAQAAMRERDWSLV
jgi:TP901 family phage tail tape measure protein